MAKATMKELLEAGAHFGHQKARWNPKMRPFIFAERGGVHIFDLELTLKGLNDALDFLRSEAEKGKTILWVSTKKQSQDIIREEAKKCGMPFIVDRWMGGTLTNFKTILTRLKKLKQLEEKRDKDEFKNLTKKERLRIDEEIAKLNQTFEGLKEVDKVPDILFVLDIVRDKLAVTEAKKLGLSVVGVCDTNSDPDTVDLCIPGNDDAVRSIAVFCAEISGAIQEGRALHEKRAKDLPTEADKPEEAAKKPKTTKSSKKTVKEDVQKETKKAEPAPLSSGTSGNGE